MKKVTKQALFLSIAFHYATLFSIALFFAFKGKQSAPVYKIYKSDISYLVELSRRYELKNAENSDIITA